MQTIGKVVIGLVLGVFACFTLLSGLYVSTTYIENTVRDEVEARVGDFKQCRCRTGSFLPQGSMEPTGSTDATKPTGSTGAGP